MLQSCIAKSLLTGLSASICPEVSQHLSTCELKPAVFTRGEREGQREGGGSTESIGREETLSWRWEITGAMQVSEEEVRWGGATARASAVLCCRRTSIQSPLSCHHWLQTPTGPRIQRTARTRASPAALHTMHSYYLPLVCIAVNTIILYSVP